MSLTTADENKDQPRPRLLIEDHLPVAELGIESVRESTPIPGQFPKLKTLHVWWARRPLVASAAAVLGGLLPTWSRDLAERFGGRSELATEEAYRKWFLELCGIWGDPVAAERAKERARANGEWLKHSPYSYKQAFKNIPAPQQVALLHDLLRATWGHIPNVFDPTAGGGSIPFAAARYRLPILSNDLSPIAATLLRAGIELPSRYSTDLVSDLESWGAALVKRLQARIERYFPSGSNEQVTNYIFARTVACPRTGKTVPLVGDWALRRGSDPVAVRLLTHRAGRELDEPTFEIVEGGDIDFDPKREATWSRGKAVSPWDGLVIDSAYIKSEAQAGRMGEVLYAVAARTSEGRGFRAPTDVDLTAIEAAEAELARLAEAWERDGIVPTEPVPEGNDQRPHKYGMARWRDMFTPRQLFVHGCFVEEYRQLIPEVQAAIADRDRADAVLALLAMMQAKAINWNARLSSWDASRDKIRSVFDRHDFAFKNTFAEFEAGAELYSWTLQQLLDAYGEISHLLSGEGETRRALPHDLPAPDVSVTCANAGNLAHLADGSRTLVCIDPPYYDNVMYAELADFFYVWEKRTLGALWPDLFAAELSNKRDEAVANQHRFAQAGRRAGELADGDYTAKMAAIFAECRRVLADDGVMVVMFTHKRAEAWDSLGAALLQAGFSVGTSWPVRTESEQSLHQARQNSAASTILLSCRPRPVRASGEGRVYLDDIEADIRRAAGEALGRSYEQGLGGVDLLLSTYGPALSVLSEHWPVHASDAAADGTSRLLRPEEALDVARAEVVRRQRARLVGRESEFDPVTDFSVLAWSTFGARRFPFDEARRLALAVGGLEMEELTRRKVVAARSGTVELVEPRARLRRGVSEAAGGVDLERFSFGLLIDAAHTALYIVGEDGPAAAKRWLDARDLGGDERFTDCLQALVSAVPRSRTRGVWNVTEAGLLDRLVTACFPGIDVPAEEEPGEIVEQQVFAVDA